VVVVVVSNGHMLLHHDCVMDIRLHSCTLSLYHSHPIPSPSHCTPQ
jgi:hypothetical protein